jgi:wyosine [tRNA(Phe)-imidazoG37] synthetase (radical SAM superfamily)
MSDNSMWGDRFLHTHHGFCRPNIGNKNACQAACNMACWRNTEHMNSHNSSRKTSTPAFKSTRRLDQLREQIHLLHYSSRTEAAYAYWVKTSLMFIRKNISAT